MHPGVNGYLYRPGDIDALTTYALALLRSLPLRSCMGRASREIAHNHDAPTTFAQFEDIYANLTAPALAGAGVNRQLTEVPAEVLRISEIPQCRSPKFPGS